jgi:hypothetical protein
LFGSSGMRTNTPPEVIEDWDRWYRFLPLKHTPGYVGLRNSQMWCWEVEHPELGPGWPDIGERPGPGKVGPGRYGEIRVPT